MEFQLISEFKPTGDQPLAIEELVCGIESKEKFQTLLPWFRYLLSSLNFNVLRHILS